MAQHSLAYPAHGGFGDGIHAMTCVRYILSGRPCVRLQSHLLTLPKAVTTKTRMTYCYIDAAGYEVCEDDAWDDWERWVVLGVVLGGFLLIVLVFLLFS